jgi:hypothetical protein
MVPNAGGLGAHPAAVDAAGDLRVRLAALEWLRRQVDLRFDVLGRSIPAATRPAYVRVGDLPAGSRRASRTVRHERLFCF